VLGDRERDVHARDGACDDGDDVRVAERADQCVRAAAAEVAGQGDDGAEDPRTIERDEADVRLELGRERTARRDRHDLHVVVGGERVRQVDDRPFSAPTTEIREEQRHPPPCGHEVSSA
jgi:hypothetical protein